MPLQVIVQSRHASAAHIEPVAAAYEAFGKRNNVDLEGAHQAVEIFARDSGEWLRDIVFCFCFWAMIATLPSISRTPRFGDI
jgi:hypothetical protein